MLKIHAADEAIWHFIGLFHLADEKGRMRIDYDRIAGSRPDPDPGAIKPLDVSTGYPYEAPAILPDIRYAPPAEPMNAVLSEAPLPPARPIALLPLSPAALPPSVGQGLGTGLPLTTPAVPVPPLPPEVPLFHLVLPPPGSVAVIVIQRNALIDDDRMNAEDLAATLVPTDQVLARLEELTALAASLDVVLEIGLPEDEAAFRDMAEAFASATVPDDFDAQATVWTRAGHAAEGHYLNGATADQRPDVDALLPAYRQPDEPTAEPAGQHNAAVSIPASSASAGPDQPGPHEVVTGNNTLVNNSGIVSAWITAPVVAVAGNVYSYTVISQVNVVSDNDLVAALDGTGAALVVDPTLSLNYSSYVTFSNPMPERDGGGSQPQYWVTATVEGSLVSVNWVEQYNLVTDNEVISVTIHADQTLLIMGENGAVNQVSLSELGNQYDIIIVDGHVINLNAVRQANVLLDDDMITISGPGTTVSSGDNLLINDSTIIQAGAATYASPTAGYAEVLATAADGRIILPDSVLNDPAFRDLEVVRVLHVKGDLISVNIVSQTNVLGDADQVRLVLDDLSEGEAEVMVLTGSNMLINASTIAEFGVDSSIYVGGDIYTDALLHQAELVSTDASLMVGGLPGLTSEAVLFLADGMIGEEGADLTFASIGSGAAISADSMETVLA